MRATTAQQPRLPLPSTTAVRSWSSRLESAGQDAIVGEWRLSSTRQYRTCSPPGPALTACYTVHIVSRWSSGLPAIERERPSIVFTDLSMPGVNGLQLLDALRQRLGQGDVRVVRDRRRAPYSGNGCCGPAARPTCLQNCSLRPSCAPSWTASPPNQSTSVFRRRTCLVGRVSGPTGRVK